VSVNSLVNVIHTCLDETAEDSKRKLSLVEIALFIIIVPKVGQDERIHPPRERKKERGNYY